MTDSIAEDITPSAVEARVLALGMIGAHSGTGVWRTVYSPEWVDAMAMCADWARDAGLAVRRDAVGNLWAVLPGSEPGPSIVTGSHIDSQRPGGRYDGALGVIAGLMALASLKARFGTPRRTLEAVALCEEESSRFPSAGFWGSRALTGRIAPGDPDTVIGHDGDTIAEAMRAVGLDPARCAEAKRDDIDIFVELRIEQGPILEQADLPVAVVDAITSIGHRRVTLTGVQNHAGAFPMDLRNDPMAGFAEIATGLIDHAHRLGRPAVTTIGQCTVYPGGPAVIPRSVTFSIDARHPNLAAKERMYAVQEAMIAEVAARRGLSVEMETLFDLAPSVCDDGVVEALKSSAASLGIPTLTMASGAGHDT